MFLSETDSSDKIGQAMTQVCFFGRCREQPEGGLRISRAQEEHRQGRRSHEDLRGRSGHHGNVGGVGLAHGKGGALENCPGSRTHEDPHGRFRHGNEEGMGLVRAWRRRRRWDLGDFTKRNMAFFKPQRRDIMRILADLKLQWWIRLWFWQTEIGVEPAELTRDWLVLTLQAFTCFGLETQWCVPSIGGRRLKKCSDIGFKT